MSTLPLVDAFPRLVEHVPHLDLATLPTPVDQIVLDVRGTPRTVFVKRDDLSSELYGGNKVRKLEFILAEAKRLGVERLITVGAAGSHHALATAAFGRKAGFAVTLLLFPQHVTPHVREVLLSDVEFGADVRFTPRMEAVPFASWRARTFARDRALVVPAGGSSPLGTLGYVNAAFELEHQLRGDLPHTIHVPAGTLGTAVGLAIGFALLGAPTRVTGTRVVSRLVANERIIRRLASGTLSLLRDAGVAAPDVPDVRARLVLHDDFFGVGYGRPTDESEAAARAFAAAGLDLDATYTSKAAAELLVAVEQDSGRHMFWHTLGRVPPRRTDEADLLQRLPVEFRNMLARRA